MADRPILFSAPMIRALLDGRKTQTRRVLKVLNPLMYEAAKMDNGQCLLQFARFAKGDRLWVRETWQTELRNDLIKPRDLRVGAPVYYVAGGRDEEAIPACAGKTRVAIHMPRWASRLTLTVTDVRVERLQDCSAADAIGEGIEPHYGGWRPYLTSFYESDGVTPANFHKDPRESYRSLWNLINGAGSWAANPWVVAVTFTVARRNIDA